MAVRGSVGGARVSVRGIWMTRRRPLVYAAHPVLSYGTAHERKALAHLRRLLPAVTLIDPAARYVGLEDWEQDWPSLVWTLSAVVVFAGEDGSIGAGCMKEVADGIAHGVAVCVLRAGNLHELVSLRLLPLTRRSPARCAIPVAGKVTTIVESLPKGASLRVVS